MLASPAPGQNRSTESQRRTQDCLINPALEAFLREQLGAPPSQQDTRYRVGCADLNHDGRADYLVYVVGSEWCGSGGCTVFIVEGRGFRLITKLTLVRLPITVLNETSHGWRSITVQIGGGGITTYRTVKLVFDGSTYPRNPTMAAASKVPRNSTGTIVLSTSHKDTPLSKAVRKSQ